MKIFTITFFLLMVVAQWFVPVSMIMEKEDIRANGVAFKFETQPIDPNDPFRGKYITLNFKIATHQISNSGWEKVDDVYVTIENDAKGFAKISSITKERPDQGHYFLAAVMHYYNNTLILGFPFHRLYLEESKAPVAEKLYADSNREERQSSYAVVYIKDGETYLDDLMIGERSIVEIIREMNTGK